MKTILIFIIIFMSGLTFSQGLRINNNPYDKADEVTKKSKAFQREKWFYEQRMYPNNFIPKDAYKKALDQKEKLKRENGFAMRGVFDTWQSIGPTTGFYFNWNNVTSRIATAKYDPNNGDIIYIGAANGGVWKSTDAGATWTAKSDNEVSLSSGSIAIDPSNSNIIYYGTGEAVTWGYVGRGLLKSTDGGNTWINYTSGLPEFPVTSRIVIRPNHSNQLLAAMGVDGLYRSTNGGVDWTLLIPGLCNDVVFSPTGDTVYIVGEGTGYRISTDGGFTFTVNGSLSMGSKNYIALCKSSPNVLYCAIYRQASETVTVFKSTDAGFSFSQIAVGQYIDAWQAWYNFYMYVSPFDPNYAYVGTVDIFRTTDGGTNFTNITNGYQNGNVHVDQHNMDFHPTDPNQMLCVNDGGIWKSTDRGTTWTNLNTNQTLTQFYKIAADPYSEHHILGGTQDNGTQRTTYGPFWRAAFGGDGGVVCFHDKDPNYILGETQYNGIFRSTNGGFDWNWSSQGLSGWAAWIAPIISHPDSAGIFYTGREEVFKSTDWGSNWFPISSELGAGGIYGLAISKSSPNIMFATYSEIIYKSTDRGYTFSNISSIDLPTAHITSINVHPDSSQVVIITYGGFGIANRHIYKTSNGGVSWSNISGNLPDSHANDALIFYPNMPTSSYYIAMDVGVFVTNNYGQSWTELADGLPNTLAMDLDYHWYSNKLRVATYGRGVFEIQPSLPSMLIPISIIPEGYYDTVTGRLNMKDTVRIYLRNTYAPYSIVDSSAAKIDSVTFKASFSFYNATSGTYYLMTKHRNSIETWSTAGGRYFSRGISNNYDFTVNASQAFGNNLSLIGSKYCIYSGDVNQDGVIDLSDNGIIDNDAHAFASGYLDTDLNGDGFVDLSDLLIADNNAFNFVSKITP